MADILKSVHLDNPANSGTDIRILMQLALLHGCTDDNKNGVQRGLKMRKTEDGTRKIMEAPEWLLVGGNQVVRNPWRRGASTKEQGGVEGGMYGWKEGGGERSEGGALARMGSGDSNFSQRCSSGAHSAVDHTDAVDSMCPPPPTPFSLPSPLPFPSLSPSFSPEEPWLPSDLPPLVSSMDHSFSSPDIAVETSGNFPSFLEGNFSEGRDFVEGNGGEGEGQMVVGEGEKRGREGEGEGEGEVSLEEAVFEWEKLLPLDFCEETTVQEKKTGKGQMENMQNLSDLEPDWLQFEELKGMEGTEICQNNWDVSENSHFNSGLTDAGFKNNDSFNCSNGSNWGFMSDKEKTSLPSRASSQFEIETSQNSTFQNGTFQNSSFQNNSVQNNSVRNNTAQNNLIRSSTVRNSVYVNGATGNGTAGSFQESATDSNLLDRFRLALSRSSPADAALASAILLLTRPEERFPEVSQKVHGIRAANQRADALMAAAAKRVPEEFVYGQANYMQFSEGRKRKERESDELEKPSRYLSPPPYLSSSSEMMSSMIPSSHRRGREVPGDNWRGSVQESETTRSRIVPELQQNQQQNNLHSTYSGNRARRSCSGTNTQMNSNGNLIWNQNLSGPGANQLPPGGVSLEAQLADLQKEWSGKRTVGCLDLASLNVDLWIPRR